MKICTKCKVSKDLEEFSRRWDKRREKYYFQPCKECCKKWAKERRKKNGHHVRKIVRKRYAENAKDPVKLKKRRMETTSRAASMRADLADGYVKNILYIITKLDWKDITDEMVVEKREAMVAKRLYLQINRRVNHESN